MVGSTRVRSHGAPVDPHGGIRRDVGELYGNFLNDFVMFRRNDAELGRAYLDFFQQIRADHP